MVMVMMMVIVMDFDLMIAKLIDPFEMFGGSVTVDHLLGALNVPMKLMKKCHLFSSIRDQVRDRCVDEITLQCFIGFLNLIQT